MGDSIRETQKELDYAAMMEKVAAIDQRIRLRGIFREIGISCMSLADNLPENERENA